MSAPPTTRPSGGWMRSLGPIVGHHRRKIVAAALIAVAAQSIMALAPLIQRSILDDSVIHHRRPLAPMIVLLVASGVATFVLGAIRRSLGGRAAVDVQCDLQIAIHHHMQHLDGAQRDRMRTGDVMSRATSDASLVQMFLQQIGVACGNLAQLVVSFVAMLYLSPVLAGVLAVCVPVFFVVSMRFRERTFPGSWMDQRYVGAVGGIVEEAVTGVRVVKAFGQEQQEQALLRDAARTLFQSRMRTARITAFYSATLQAIPTFGQLGVLGLGGWLAIRGRVSVGVFLAFSSYVMQLVMPVRILSTMLSTSQQARAGAQRILALLAVESDVRERPDAVDLVDPVGAVRLESVSFGYLPDRPVLRDITLDIAPGERVAIVGGSGSGKSTLAMLLARFYDPTTGRVLVDGTDIRDLRLRSLRQGVGIVFDDSFLFATTIRDNIAFARPDAGDDEIRRAAAAAQAHDFISALRDGYDTVVGERGYTLSGGQRQRIALARMILSNPKVLVLDDATSAIDSRTEEAIHRSFHSEMSDRTTILIANRHSTLRLADRVVLLDGGRVVAQGTTDELLATSPLFRELLTGPDAASHTPPAVPVTDIEQGAWPTDVSRHGAPRSSSRGEALAAASGGGGGWAGATAHLAGLASESGELMESVRRLPPLAGEPDVEEPGAERAEDSFTFARIVRPFRTPLLIGAALVLVDAATSLAAPLLVRHGIDAGVLKSSQGALWTVCLTLLGVQIISWINAVVMTRQTSRTAERMLFGLRVRTFAHLQRLSLDFYDQQMAGKIMTRMTSDVEAFAQLLQQGLLTALVSLLSCGGVLVLLVLMDHVLALSLVAVLPFLVVTTMWFRKASDRTYLTSRQRVSVLYADLQESLAGARVSQAFGRQEANEERFRRLAVAYRDSRRHSVDLIAVFFPFLQLLNIVTKSIVLVVGARMITRGHLTVGILIAFLLYLDQFFAPVQQLSMVFDQWLQAKVAVGQLGELLRTPTSTPLIDRPRRPGRPSGHIRFEHVEFAYASTGLVVMSDVNLDIEAGQVVALVGTTGAGKSTLVKLVARFYDPTRGRVLIDGVPLDELDLTAYRHQLGFVPQEPFLFSGTVRSNIAYGHPDAEDVEVERAARAVGAHDFITALPHGYHTPISEQGRSLSAGQRQLLSLARAQLVDPAILLLDEATANLDLATEARVQHAMSLVARGRTTLLIAHRLQTARAAQRILVIDEGRVVEDGSHEQLVQAGGPYASLWEAFVDGQSGPVAHAAG